MLIGPRAEFPGLFSISVSPLLASSSFKSSDSTCVSVEDSQSSQVPSSLMYPSVYEELHMEVTLTYLHWTSAAPGVFSISVDGRSSKKQWSHF